MTRITLRQTFDVFLALSIILPLVGTGALVYALNFPISFKGKRVYQETVPLTMAMNGTRSVEFQAVDRGEYEISAHPDPWSRWFYMKSTYISTSSNGPPLNESYASYLHVRSDYAVVYDLKPGTYYLVAKFNLTLGESRWYNLWVGIYHSYPDPDPYQLRLPAYGLFATGLASVMISGVCWAKLKRRTPGIRLGLKVGSLISFVAALLAILSTALPWYAYSFYQRADGRSSTIRYAALQDLVDYGLNSPFEPAVGKASFLGVALGLVFIGGFLALVGSAAVNMYQGKGPNVLLAVSGILTLLSPAIVSFGFLSSGIPLYGKGGISPYLFLGFLSYGFFCTIIAGILILIASVITPTSNKGKQNSDNRTSSAYLIAGALT